MSYRDKNHNAATQCGQLIGTGFMSRCYRVATVRASAPATEASSLFCNRHASYLRKGQGGSQFAGLVRAGVAVLTEVGK